MDQGNDKVCDDEAVLEDRLELFMQGCSNLKIFG